MMQTQVTSQREEVKSLIIQQQKMIQSQVSEMERRLKDEFFSHIGSSAEATRPASGTLPVISSIESDVNESVHGVTEAFFAL